MRVGAFLFERSPIASALGPWGVDRKLGGSIAGTGAEPGELAAATALLRRHSSAAVPAVCSNRAMMHELLSMDAVAQADAVRRRDVSAVELVEAAIARAEHVNARLNALVTPLFEQAVEAARGPLPDGPLRGVPFILKDLVSTVEGVPHHEGSRYVAGYVADRDSEYVRRPGWC